MNVEPSLWSFIANASLVVKCVMLLLVTASVASWTFILQRGFFLQRVRREVSDFEERFWSGGDLHQLYEACSRRVTVGLASIFCEGFKEFTRLNEKASANVDAVMEGAQRAMRVATAHETEQLEQHLAFLATVGSTSPYVGLFGTVWGIMTAFRALGQVQAATISMVAPGISEALIATAMGLFAAIPAVIAYNRYADLVERLTHQYETFQEEFSNILHRQIYGRTE